MATQIPIKVLLDGSSNTCGLAQFAAGDTVGTIDGGTGLATQGICAFAQPGIQAIACKTTYIGICAGKSEAAADENTYVGYGAGQNVTTGCYHTIIGSNAGDAITTCSSSVLIGYNAGTAITFGDRNTAIGTNAGAAITTATDNTLVGYISGCVTTGNNNTGLGACVLALNTVGVDNVVIGSLAGKTQVAAGCNNTYIGSQAGEVALCRDNTLIGAYAGTAQTTATCNVMLGGCVGYGVVGGAGNVYLGYKSGLVNTSGNDNVFIGKASGVGSTASCCLIIGNGTCDLITGDFNTPLISMVGCVGIGTTAPDGTLHAFTASAGSVTAIATGDDLIVENSDHTGITILSPNDKQGGIYFGDPEDNDVGLIAYQHSSDAMQFYTNAGLRMAIDSAGLVGIGTTAPGGNMEIAGSGAETDLIINNTAANGDPAIKWQLSGTTKFMLAVDDDNADVFNMIAGDSIPGNQMTSFDANKNVSIGGTGGWGSSAVGVLSIKNGTPPGSSIANFIQLYAEDVSSSSELKVRDEAGNITVLSPHDFTGIPDGPSEDLAWAYSSQRDGQRINVDMLKLARTIEKLSGEQLVYIDEVN